LENSSLLVSRGLHRVLADLAEVGYDAEWLVLGGDEIGTIYHRPRFWMVAHAQGERQVGEPVRRDGSLEDATPVGSGWLADYQRAAFLAGRERWQDELGVRLLADDVADRVAGLSAAFNGQVPAVAATAWSVLMSRISKEKPDAERA